LLAHTSAGHAPRPAFTTAVVTYAGYMLHSKSKRHRRCSMQRLRQGQAHSCRRQLLQMIQAVFVFTEDSHQWPCRGDIGSTIVKASDLQSVHDQVIQVLLVRQEVAELLGHQLLHTCFLSTDEALNHHTADRHSSSAHVLLCRAYSDRNVLQHARKHSVAALCVNKFKAPKLTTQQKHNTCCHSLTSSCSMSNMNKYWEYEDIT